jgi:ubiquinone/menaquinone biosynthesis C-methylase UbiE
MGEHSVAEHYGTAPLAARVDAALAQAGLADKPLDWSDLTALDQFHTRGLPATQELAAALAPEPGSTLLDIGSGIGGPARFFAATRGVRVTGIDLTPSFVELAAALSARTGLAGQTTFLQADALALPFPDAAFDHAMTLHVAMNIADRAGFYAEAARVLKPGGRFAILDIVQGEGGPLVFPVPWAPTPEISFLLTGDAMRDALTTAGFSIASWTDLSDPTLDAFAAQQAGQQPGQSPVSLLSMMGPEFARTMATFTQNLRERRVRVLQVIAVRA